MSLKAIAKDLRICPTSTSTTKKQDVAIVNCILLCMVWIGVIKDSGKVKMAATMIFLHIISYEWYSRATTVHKCYYLEQEAANRFHFCEFANIFSVWKGQDIWHGINEGFQVTKAHKFFWWICQEIHAY